MSSTPAKPERFPLSAPATAAQWATMRVASMLTALLTALLSKMEEGTPAHVMASLLFPQMIAAQIKVATEYDPPALAHFGTIGEITKRAEEHTSSLLVSDFVGGKKKTMFSLPSTLTVGEYVAALEAHLELSKGAAKSVTNAWLLTNTPKSDKIDGILAERRKLEVAYLANLTTLGQFPGVVIPGVLKSLPEEPKLVKRSKSTSTSTGSTERVVRFYRIVNGEPINQPNSGNSIAQMAFQHYGNCGVDNLKAAIIAANDGTEPNYTQESVNLSPAEDGTEDEHTWTVSVNGKSHRLGWRIEEPKPAATEDDSTEDDDSIPETVPDHGTEQ